MAANFKIKFMFADAVTIEEEFPPQTTVAEAKAKLISSSWPAGWAPAGPCAPRAPCWRTRSCALPRDRGEPARGASPCAQPAARTCCCSLAVHGSIGPLCGTLLHRHALPEDGGRELRHSRVGVLASAGSCRMPLGSAFVARALSAAEIVGAAVGVGAVFLCVLGTA